MDCNGRNSLVLTIPKGPLIQLNFAKARSADLIDMASAIVKNSRLPFSACLLSAGRLLFTFDVKTFDYPRTVIGREGFTAVTAEEVLCALVDIQQNETPLLHRHTVTRALL